MTDKKDVFYYAKLYGIPIYFQPEENEVVPRNAFCGFLLLLLALIILPILRLIPDNAEFGVKIYHKTITREELIKKGVVE